MPLSNPITEPQIPQPIARDTEVTAAINAHLAAADPHAQYLLPSEGDARYRRSAEPQTFTPAIRSLILSSGSVGVNYSATTGDQSGLEVRASDSNSAAYISFHRPGNFAAHFGLDIDNKLCWGGWSLGNNSYKIFHEGEPPQVKNAPAPTAVIAANSFVLTWNAINANQGTAEFVNYCGTGGGDSYGFYRISGNAVVQPTVTNRVARIDINGAYIQTSDKRVKSDFLPAPGLSVVLGLLPQKYQHWECLGCDDKDKKILKLGKIFTHKVGFVAQEVQKILPEAVTATASDDELYGLDYSCIVACAVRAIQELNEQVADLRAQLQKITKV